NATPRFDTGSIKNTPAGVSISVRPTRQMRLSKLANRAGRTRISTLCKIRVRSGKHLVTMRSWAARAAPDILVSTGKKTTQGANHAIAPILTCVQNFVGDVQSGRRSSQPVGRGPVEIHEARRPSHPLQKHRRGQDGPGIHPLLVWRHDVLEGPSARVR